jgi:hypothetical protein
MSISHPGTAQAFAMKNVDFGFLGATEGSILTVTDTASSDGVPLSLDVTSATLANGCFRTFRDGALVTWNGVPCQ